MHYVGVDLLPRERSAYDRLTKRLAKVLEKLRYRYGHRLDAMRDSSLSQKLQAILKTDEHPDRAIGDYFRITQERRQVVYDSATRKAAYLDLLRKTINDGKKIIVFHERIKQLADVVAAQEHRPSRSRPEAKAVDQELEDLLDKRSYRPVMYHSGHEKSSWNQWSMDWFRSDIANVMLSVKALIEGVDVPRADLGIVRVSSSSVRQRIQTTGRVLRKAKGKKESDLIVVYVRNTVDERIFKAYDWASELGSSAVALERWRPQSPNEASGYFEKLPLSDLPVVQDYERELPPREVDVSQLSIGDLYPGRYAGRMLHADSSGKPFVRSRWGREQLSNPELIQAGQEIRRLKEGGRFLITSQGNIVTKIHDGSVVFLGTIDPNTLELPGGLGRDKHEDRKKKRKSQEVRRSEKPPTFEELFFEEE